MFKEKPLKATLNYDEILIMKHSLIEPASLFDVVFKVDGKNLLSMTKDVNFLSGDTLTIKVNGTIDVELKG